MKILITVIGIIGLQYLAISQTDRVFTQASSKHSEPGSGIFFVSSGESGTSRAKFTPSNQCRDIIITDIPLSTLPLSSVNIDPDAVGVFTFKADESLKIPANYEVFIEDKLTGRVFNLINSRTYRFNVEQHAANRFVMHVLNKTNYNETVTLN